MSPPDEASVVQVRLLERRDSGRVIALRHGSPRRQSPLGALIVDEGHGSGGPSCQAERLSPQSKGINGRLWRQRPSLQAHAGLIAKRRLVAPGY